MQRVYLIILIFTTAVASRAQDKFIGYYEPYVQLEYAVTEIYSQEYTIESRTFWYDEGNFEVKVKQLDLAHFSSFKLNDKNALALGVQYRFEENFGGDGENELRLTEEYTFTTRPNATEFEHRIRAEQRITESSTSHRFRYNFAIARPFKGNGIDTGETYFLGNLETLLTVANYDGPDYEQRIGAGIGWSLTDFAELEIVAEYRLSDFTRDLGHELFFVTGLNLKL